ncbi:3D domain-containing protein [Paenibacillus thiaminolyticus]|uniref:LysM peptidoglycan-binding domain-containing protein n=1 Tax=Paenibacillus thiaminolyticus TaxID=49283 RepID=A0A3A3GIJ8_PANTH|nr:3D domain-containing protein [Paenibacillus thiaminolyticus]RJG22085.1 LysM peptidoglycan-binding domain-containing protein [Paenibacillus thiaminolyticus]
MRKKSILKLTTALIGLNLVFQMMPVYAEPYTAQEGDTFYKLAKKHQIDLDELMKANANIDPLNIYGGLKLELPKKTLQGLAVESENVALIEADRDKDASAADKAGASADKPAKAAKEAAAPAAKVQTEEKAKPAAKAQTEEKAKPAAKAQTEEKANTAAKAQTEEKANAVAATAKKNVITVSGKEMTYKKKVNMKATAYTAHASENGKWGAVDYFGNPLKLGTVAVDPKVIPLGTKLFITGYQFQHLPQGGFIAEARDIGGAINGNKIDIFVPVSKQIGSTFGIQNVEVYIMS